LAPIAFCLVIATLVAEVAVAFGGVVVEAATTAAVPTLDVVVDAGFDTTGAGAGLENVVLLLRLREKDDDRLGLDDRLKLELPRANRSALFAIKRTNERAKIEKRLIETSLMKMVSCTRILQ